MSKSGSRSGIHPEECFRVLFEQAADGIYISSEDGVYLEVNPSGHRLLGYENGELIGKRIADIVRPADINRLDVAIASLLKGEISTLPWHMVRKDGSLIETEVRAQRLSNGRLLGVVRDLSTRTAIEKKIRESESQLRSILETAPDVILAVDRARKILFINRTLPPLVPEQVVGTSCFDYLLPEERGRVAGALDRVFATAVLEEYEVHGPPGPDGVRGVMSVRAGPLMDGDQVAAAILCATDVTARRTDEARFRELASRWKKISSQVPGWVYQFKLRPDGTSCFPYASDGIRDICRLTPDEVRDDASKVFALLHPEDYDRVVESVNESAKALESFQHDFRIKFPNGDERWLDSKAVPERQDDGSVLWHGFVHDITARKEGERLKAQLEEQLRQSQKVESIGKLAGGVAHDFNNLLTSIMGFVELALMHVAPDTRAAEYLDGVRESAKRGASLTQQLLAFARKKIVRPEVIDLNEVLRRLTVLLRRLVGENLELVVSTGPNLNMVKVDVGSMEQVVMNLVVNARDAITTGTGRITLETKNVVLDEAYCQMHAEMTPGEFVMLAVTDTGIGMTPSIRAKLFEPFFTTKPVGHGTGLGLAMCHGIIKQAGGNISVHSEPGAGSTFRVYLPRSDGEEVAPTSLPRLSTLRGRETILLVEDEGMILRVARDALAGLGYRIITASDGAQALDMVKTMAGPVDLLVTDVVMPKMGGRELARRLSKLRPDIRVLFSSGYTENSIVEHGVLDEGVEFLQKPYTPVALARRVREVLDRSSALSSGGS